MNRPVWVITGLIVLSLGFAPVLQAKSIGQSALKEYDTTKLVGATVKARDGAELGRIFDLVIDTKGHVDFAVISQPGFEEFPGRLVAVPFGALKLSQEKSQEIQAVLKGDKEKFYEAPEWGDKNLSDRKEAASLDRYFGVRPYWTEEMTKPSSHGQNH